MQCLHGKQKDAHKYILMVDIRKAFDSVDRQMLFDIIKKRCRDSSQMALAKLVESLYSTNTLLIGD